MTRIIYNPETGTEYRHPRADGQAVEGLQPPLVDLLVIQLPLPEMTEGQSASVGDTTYDLEAGTATRGWILQDPPAEETIPQWVAFGAAVMAAPAINALLGTAIANGAAALAMGLSVGLGKAADGDSRVFLQAWSQANQLGLISAELTEAIAAMAAAHDLPAEFVAALAP
jgi:hypothetical protein